MPNPRRPTRFPVFLLLLLLLLLLLRESGVSLEVGAQE